MRTNEAATTGNQPKRHAALLRTASTSGEQLGLAARRLFADPQPKRSDGRAWRGGPAGWPAAAGAPRRSGPRRPRRAPVPPRGPKWPRGCPRPVRRPRACRRPSTCSSTFAQPSRVEASALASAARVQLRQLALRPGAQHADALPPTTEPLAIRRHQGSRAPAPRRRSAELAPGQATAMALDRVMLRPLRY